tara:strand:+ start:266 stop:370 length:105 start_codon:yes stop_codon:yes gene_type:complete
MMDWDEVVESIQAAGYVIDVIDMSDKKVRYSSEI